MLIFSLGCGAWTNSDPAVMNIDWSIYLRLRLAGVFRSVALPLLQGVHYERILSLPDNILVRDLAKGIPYAEGSVDVVYHSQISEHLDQEVAAGFFKEVHRVVVPNFKAL